MGAERLAELHQPGSNWSAGAALPPWVALCPPHEVLWGVWANLVYPVHIGKKQETACQEGHNEFSLT